MLSEATAALHFCGVVVVCFISWMGNGEAEELPLESSKSLQCQIVAQAVFPEIILAEEDPSVSEDVSVALGGISDVTVEKVVNDDGQIVVRLLTDRGPSRKIETANGKQRLFLNLSFVPTVLIFDVSGCQLDKTHGRPKKLNVELQSQFLAAKLCRKSNHWAFKRP